MNGLAKQLDSPVRAKDWRAADDDPVDNGDDGTDPGEVELHHWALAVVVLCALVSIGVAVYFYYDSGYFNQKTENAGENANSNSNKMGNRDFDSSASLRGAAANRSAQKRGSLSSNNVKERSEYRRLPLERDGSAVGSDSDN